MVKDVWLEKFFMLCYYLDTVRALLNKSTPCVPVVYIVQMFDLEIIMQGILQALV